MDLYIYYRVWNGNAATLCARVRAMQQCLAQEYGIVTALKRRPHEKEGRQTWMEIYQDVPAGFDQALEGAVRQAGLDDLTDGPRNTEHFVDVSSCA